MMGVMSRMNESSERERERERERRRADYRDVISIRT